MKRQITSFVCQECGYDTPKYYGKCPECGSWNSLREFQLKSKVKSQKSKIGDGIGTIEPKTLQEVTSREDIQNDIAKRLSTQFAEVDTVLGGGIVKGSVTLLAGDPGIGKSTLLLQIALNTARLTHVARDARKAQFKSKDSPRSLSENRPQTESLLKENSKSIFSSLANDQARSTEGETHLVLYISGEESEEQIGLRAKRIVKDLHNSSLLLISLNNTDAILEVVEKVKPMLVIIDSIQTVESENLEGLSGSVGQVRYATSVFVRQAKTLGIPFILVGHVTKEGMVAGPMVLSHMVDTVLFLEGEKTTGTRILRSFKNRFGPVDEVGIFVMGESGMKEVGNPESLFITQQKKDVPGSVLVVTMEGTRAFLVEIQALAVPSKLPIPRRVASGIDQKRIELLLAILQKHVHIPVGVMDIFVNVAGGIKISDPACDLGICLSIYSSYKNIPMGRTVGIAEVGLQGELRSVPFLEKRIKETQKLGFNSIISASNFKYIGEVTKSLK